jgi:nucleoside-triphosphatase THEP1
MSEKKQIKISEVLDLLKQGLNRPAIAKHYDMSMAECRRLFAHPKLKSKKALKQSDFVLLDDTEVGEIEVASQDVSAETEEILEVQNATEEESTTENVTQGGAGKAKAPKKWENE